MKISYNWLQRYLSPLPSPEETSALLTATGLEVESIEKFESVKGGYRGLLTGQVITCTQHPNADRLKLTTVDTGTGTLLSIVCGAPNVEAGLKVIVATIGTELHPVSGEAFTIKESKIRGELSQGMLCAEDEIGLGESHLGLMILPEDTPVGIPLSEYFGVTEDSVFEIGLTPNRSDAMSHYGVARDLSAAMYKQQTNLIKPEIRESFPEGTDFPIKVAIESDAVIRYSGLSISGITVSESPAWLQTALKAIGLKPINNIVDVTNFVLHETGQPLHAFDSEKIAGNSIVVKTVEDGTRFTTLDGTERKLSSKDLMICDAEKPLCIAGVFGGSNSGVSSSTTDIFIESATFNPVSVRKTSKAHNLKTDSSFRFERGTDPEITIYALQRAADLIKEIAGGTVAGSITDHYPVPVKWAEVEYSWQKMDRLVGEKIPRDQAKTILIKSGIYISNETEEGLSLRVPPYKVDVKGEADVTEEILRIYGYNTIEIPAQLRSSLNPVEKPDVWQLKNRISDSLCSIGCTEVLNNSLTSITINAFFRKDENQEVKILNPLSSELNVMRSSLIASVCETIAWNRNRQQPDLAVFEWGRSYFKSGAGSEILIDKEKILSDFNPVSIPEEPTGYEENELLTIAVTGNSGPESWHLSSKKSGYFQLKGTVERVFSMMGIDPQLVSFTPVEHAALDEAQELRLKKHVLATVGKVNGSVKKHFGIDAEVWIAECSWDKLLIQLKRFKPEYQEVSKYPSVRRDLALLLDSGVKFDQVLSVAKSTERKLLKEVNLFDVYEGDKLPAGKKSYAVSYIFQDEEQTLTDKQIEKTMVRLIAAYKEQLGAELRS